jgi:hypothetical protein
MPGRVMLGQPGVADGEDADVLAVQPPRRDAPSDLGLREPGIEELHVADRSVLAGRGPRDLRVLGHRRDRLERSHGPLR